MTGTAIGLLCNISLHLDLNYDKAEEHGKKAYELNPNNPTVLASYGKSLVQLVNVEKESNYSVKLKSLIL